MHVIVKKRKSNKQKLKKKNPTVDSTSERGFI